MTQQEMIETAGGMLEGLRAELNAARATAAPEEIAAMEQELREIESLFDNERD